MSAQDYRVNAEVRRLLVSRWVDVSMLQIGTTNGVVYVLGRLDTTMEDPTKRADPRRRSSNDRNVLLVVALEKDLRRMRDVRDVVIKLQNVIKRGGRWRAVDGNAADRRQLHGPTVPVPRVHAYRPAPVIDLEDSEGEVLP